MDPATSTTIQSELKYSIDIARLSLPILHAMWLFEQQHWQFAHSRGSEQFSHEVSAQPQDWHDMGENDMAKTWVR